MSEKTLKIAAPLIGALTLVWGVLQYQSTTNLEFRKKFWEEQFALYQEITNEAAAIATANRPQDVEKERKNFWILYMGKVPMIEHPEVKEALDNYADVLSAIEKKENPLLLRTDLKFSDQLDRKDELSSDLRQEFEEKDVVLSDNVVVSVEAIDRWRVMDEDHGRTYIIKREADQLNIYWLPSRDELLELAYQIALACRSSLNKTWNPVDMDLLVKC